MNNRWLMDFLKIVLSIPLLCSLGYSASPQNTPFEKENYESVKSYITQYAETKMKENQLTGLSLALVDDEKIIWTLSLGYADLENKKPVTSDTLFRIGSISKLFTATAIMQLVEQGKIDLDKPLQTYIPEFSMKTRFPDAGPVTIRSIMTHSSGLPCDYLPVSSPSYPYFTQLVKDIQNEYVAYPPGYITAYSNLAVALLGVVIERVSGQKFNDYITEHIFKPLEMNHSSFELRADMEPLLSKGYRNNEPAEDMFLGVFPSGSMVSDVNEMSHFMQMVLDKGSYKGQQIVKERTLEEMFTPQTNIPLDLDARGTIGLNWGLDQNPSWGKIVAHAGGTYLFFSWMKVLPEKKLGVIILTNSANGFGPAYEISNELINAALKVKIGTMVDDYPKPSVHKQNAEMKLIPPEGHYATGLGLVTIKKQGENLYAEIQAYPRIKFLIEPQLDQTYTLKPLLFGLFPKKIKDLEKLRFFVADVAGTRVAVLNHNGIRSIGGVAIEVKALPVKWKKRCGEYRLSPNTGFTQIQAIKLQYFKGTLALSYKVNGKMNLPVVTIPFSDSGLLIPGLGRNWNTTIQFMKVGNEERLIFEGLEFVKEK